MLISWDPPDPGEQQLLKLPSKRASRPRGTGLVKGGLELHRALITQIWMLSNTLLFCLASLTRAHLKAASWPVQLPEDFSS